jgi:CheY-like chemotaxis protein
VNVLIADSDPMVRLSLARMVQRTAVCEITEVDNGLDLLDRLGEGHFDLLVLDLLIPGMDGYEVLRVIRASPRLRQLPVMVVSAVKDERGVTDAIRLGVRDYISKPLHGDQLAGRLARVMQSAPSPAESERRLRASLEPGRTLMIVDANGEFRQFFISVLESRNPVIEASSGAQALKLIPDPAPSAVFIGHDIGAISPRTLVRKIREKVGAVGTSVLGAWPKARLEAARQTHLFDEVIARTYVKDVLLGQVEQVYSRGLAEDLEALLKQVEPRLWSSIEQVFGMMLATDLTPGGLVLPQAPTVVIASDIMREGSHPLLLRMAMPLHRAREFAARLLLIDDATPDDGVAGMKEVASVIVARVQQTLSHAGTTVTCSSPEALIAEQPPQPAAAGATRITQTFSTDSGEPVFTVELGSVEVAAEAAA